MTEYEMKMHRFDRRTKKEPQYCQEELILTSAYKASRLQAACLPQTSVVLVLPAASSE